jgi:mannose-6-phosphate isomerase-like protein (cupin superfamily)
VGWCQKRALANYSTEPVTLGPHSGAEATFDIAMSRGIVVHKPVRRVVTGHNADGRSCFISDGPAPNVFQRSPRSTIVTELWKTLDSPADNGTEAAADPTVPPYRLTPPEGGTVVRIISYPPDSVRLAALEQERAGAADVASDRAAALDRGNPRHPGFHKTNSIDYAIVLSGEIYALMDEGETLLRAGDVLIQRGTNHAWSNRTNEPAVLAFVLIDAKPL